jgi:hypothetical protein
MTYELKNVHTRQAKVEECPNREGERERGRERWRERKREKRENDRERERKREIGMAGMREGGREGGREGWGEGGEREPGTRTEPCGDLVLPTCLLTRTETLRIYDGWRRLQEPCPQ